METRRLIVALAASMLVFVAWMFVGPIIMPAPPQPPTTQAARSPSTQQATTAAASRPSSADKPTSPATSQPAAQADARAQPPETPARPAETRSDSHRLRAVQGSPGRVLIGDDDPKGEFALMLGLNSRGATVADADLAPTLPRYRNFPAGDRRANLDEDEDPFDSYDMLRALKDDASGGVFRSFSTEEVNILLGGEGSAPLGGGGSRAPASTRSGERGKKDDWHAVDLSDKHWSIERRSEDDRDVAVCKIDIEADGKPILRVVKTYTLFKGGFDVSMDLSIKSLDDRDHRVIVTQQGPVNIHSQQMRGDSRKVYYALSVAEGVQSGSTERKETVLEEKDEQGRKKIGFKAVELPPPDTEGKLLWSALGNQYFAAIVTPVDPDRKADSTDVESTQVIHLTHNTGADENGDMTFRFVSRPSEVKAGAPFEFRFDLYIGPKERTFFEDKEGQPTYVARHYLGTIEEEYYFCVWAPLAELMSKLLVGLHNYIWPHNWGLAIIILVLVVRVILHPVTKKGQVSMTRMQTRMGDLQPKIDELKKKHGGDRNKVNEEMMALYKKEGINPASNVMGCLPMLLQMPIWVALWATLSNTIELRHAPFMIIPGRWILDLAAPDALIRFAKPVQLLFFNIDALNVLPFLWGISMVLQQKLMPKSKSGKTSEQAQQQQRMMYMMAIVFTVMFYSFPSGLTLYIMASNFFGLIEQWRIRKHLEAEQEEGPAPVPVPKDDAGPKKPKGLAASVMQKFDKFDQDQRAIKGKKRKK